MGLCCNPEQGWVDGSRIGLGRIAVGLIIVELMLVLLLLLIVAATVPAGLLYIEPVDALMVSANARG